MEEISKDKKIKFNFIQLSGLIIFILILGIIISLIFQNRELKSSLSNTEETLETMRQTNTSIQKKVKELEDDNEKIRADSSSIIAQDLRLKKQIEQMRSNLEKSKEAIELSEADLQRKEKEIAKLKKEIEKTKEKNSSQTSIKRKKLEEDLEALSQSNKELNETITKERAIYHYNLAVAYTQAKLYDEAIDEYKKSLSYKEDNAEAHYNLGLLYENVKDETDTAAQHYAKYLKIKPEAEDKEEVGFWIKRLIRGSESPTDWKERVKKETTAVKSQYKSNFGPDNKK